MRRFAIPLFPGTAADSRDAIAIYWDDSANGISRKTFDDSQGQLE